MGKLIDYFENNNKRLIDKWTHYFDIYEHHFGRFVGRDVNILEIGVFHGGSLQMWKHYFGKKASIFGVDINPLCKSFEEDQIKILVGDQGDRTFLRELKQSLPKIDIIIDDGGHLMHQQKITFEELFPTLSPNGVYLIEDLHTSYWAEFGGGLRNPNSFIEYSKSLIDNLNAWHSRNQLSPDNHFTSSAWSMSYYDSMLVIEKRPQQQGIRKVTGNPSM
ncbi:class I SAM-dependent methyltransferase [Paenibacillus montanisoli]|uniref:Class I SAM-dependent methyltransferase n=1 Tax=Paenibacillus montanisoli TaxID=2081970 RepID=A0A328UEA2_9BACL|nr:class I SAM-dependent methyltransferase [Paenibacillus montanisoli]RAP78276.1 class I SAM-dependent methyltransferase [Paenibacillus montanisoli]